MTSTTGILPLLYTSTIFCSVIHGPLEVPTALHIYKFPPKASAHYHRSNTDWNSLVDDQQLEKPISYFYQALQALSSKDRPLFLTNWEQDPQKTLSERATILQLTHTSSMSSKKAEVNYKLLTRWHYTTVVLHKVFPTISPLCFGEDVERGQPILADYITLDQRDPRLWNS